MNAPFRPERRPRRFTTADVVRMAEVGVIGRDERIELVDGELRQMSPKANHHELVKNLLVEWFSLQKSRSLFLAVESTLYLAPDTFLEPDLLLYPRGIAPMDARGPDVTLLIEVADSSLAHDLGPKAALYARFGVAHYWVIDAARRIAHCFAEPGEGGYARQGETGPLEPLTPPGVDAAVTLGTLD